MGLFRKSIIDDREYNQTVIRPRKLFAGDFDVIGLKPKLVFSMPDKRTINETANKVFEWDNDGSFPQNAVQGTSTRQPTYTENHIGSLPALVADGADNLDTGYQSNGTETVFVVMKTPAAFSAAYSPFGSYSTVGGVRRAYFRTETDGTVRLAYGSASALTTTVLSVSTDYLISAVLTGTAGSLWINGVLDIDAFAYTWPAGLNNDSHQILSRTFDGNPSDFYLGAVSDVILFDYVLSDAERTAVERLISEIRKI